MRKCSLFFSTVTAFLIIVFLFSGCLQRSKAPYQIDRYILDYPVPDFKGFHRGDESIRVERFSIAQAYNTTAMVYKTAAFRLDSYVGSRWSIHPADMLNDLLSRDLRATGLFSGVFSFESDERVRYVLDGSIDQFYESDESTVSTAILSINIILYDERAPQPSKQVRFQKAYRYSNRISDKNAEAFAKGMTKNAEDFSRDLTNDLSVLLTQGGV